MSTEIELASQDEAVDTSLKFENIPSFYTESGLPFFFAMASGNDYTIDDYLRVIGEQNITHYYIMANHVITWEEKFGHNSTKVNSGTQPRVFKVTTDLVGRSMNVMIGSCADDFCIAKESKFEMQLPKLPYELLQKVEKFFRAIDKEFHSEAIILLGFDERYSSDDPEGWRVIVPEQENNAAHCKYDHEGAVAKKDPHIDIVGSIHSHPGMPAYASGTDHNDQATFPGIHLTFGWQASKGNVTDIHAEYSAGNGTNIILDVSEVCEGYTPPEVDNPELEEWIGQVKKSQPAVSVTYNNNKSYYSHSSQTKTTSKWPESSYKSTYNASFQFNSKEFNKVFGEVTFENNHKLNPFKDIVLCELPFALVEKLFADDNHNTGIENFICPACLVAKPDNNWANKISSFSLKKLYCSNCKMVFVIAGSTKEDIEAQLARMFGAVHTPKNIYIWDPQIEDFPGSNTITLILNDFSITTADCKKAEDYTPSPELKKFYSYFMEKN